jgi:hypothetical protein
MICAASFVTVAESADISPLALKALVNHSLPRASLKAMSSFFEMVDEL